MKIRNHCLVVILLILCGCEQPRSDSPASVSMADIIFTGDHIITLDADTPDVTAVAVTGQKIAATGSLAELEHLRSDTTRIVELGERALIPGFIDAHGHMTSVARLIVLIDLASPPVGSVQNIDDIVELVRNRITEQQLDTGARVFVFGYDDSQIP